MRATLPAIERRQGDRAVMGACAPGRAEFRPRRRDDEQRRQRAAFGEPAQKIERRRIGPMQILEREHDRLRACPRRHPCEQRCHLPAPQFLRRELRSTLRGQRNVNKWREQRHIFGGVELVVLKRHFQIGEAPLGGHISTAEAEAAPLGDRVQRRVLQQLRGTPLHPGVRRLD
jgi:hypothetical protein